MPVPLGWPSSSAGPAQSTRHRVSPRAARRPADAPLLVDLPGTAWESPPYADQDASADWAGVEEPEEETPEPANNKSRAAAEAPREPRGAGRQLSPSVLAGAAVLEKLQVVPSPVCASRYLLRSHHGRGQGAAARLAAGARAGGAGCEGRPPAAAHCGAQSQDQRGAEGARHQRPRHER